MGGGDKTLLDLGGQPVLARILATLRADHATVAISANGDPSRFARFGVPVLDDGEFAGQGPLAGVLAGLDHAAAERAAALLTVPGDTPFIPPGLAVRLAPGPACAATAGRAHWLVALWPVALRADMRRWLRSGRPRRVQAFAEAVGMHPVALAGSADDPAFLNINTPADLSAARALLRGG